MALASNLPTVGVGHVFNEVEDSLKGGNGANPANPVGEETINSGDDYYI